MLDTKMTPEGRIVRDTVISQYVTVSGLALLLYDHCLTLAAEVELVWPAKMSPVKCAFLINRYVCPLVLSFICAVNSGHWKNLDDKFCHEMLNIVSLVEPLLLTVGTFIICTRVYSIWGGHRTAFWVLSTCWTIHLVIDIVLLSVFGALKMTRARYLPEYNLCSIEKHYSWAMLLNSIALHTILVLLLLYIWISTPRNSKTRFSQLIIRDGCISYITMQGPLLLSLVMSIRARSSLAALFFYFIWSTTSISVSRSLLSIKGVRGPEEWGQTMKIVVPDMELAHRSNYELNHSRELLI